MLSVTRVPANSAGMPSVALPPRYINAEADRRDVNARIEAMRVRLHRERRAQFYRNLFSLWPAVLGLGLSCFAAPIHDAVAGYAPLLAKSLFPLSALAAFHDVHFGFDAMPTLSQAMLYAQFSLDGLFAGMLLRKRSAYLTVCGQVALFHVLFLFCIGFVTGSFRGIVTN